MDHNSFDLFHPEEEDKGIEANCSLCLWPYYRITSLVLADWKDIEDRALSHSLKSIKESTDTSTLIRRIRSESYLWPC